MALTIHFPIETKMPLNHVPMGSKMLPIIDQASLPGQFAIRIKNKIIVWVAFIFQLLKYDLFRSDWIMKFAGANVETFDCFSDFFFLAHFLFKLYIIAMFHHSILHHILWPAPLIPSFGALQILLRGMKPHPQIFPHCFRIFRDLLVVDGNQFLAIPEGKNFP